MHDHDAGRDHRERHRLQVFHRVAFDSFMIWGVMVSPDEDMRRGVAVRGRAGHDLGGEAPRAPGRLSANHRLAPELWRASGR